MNANSQLQKLVIKELESGLGESHGGIAVSVDDGAVVLSGTAGTYSEKYAAERAAQRVPGVRVISERVRVGDESHEPSDDLIAKAVAHALQQDLTVPAAVQATVERGWVTLRGEVASATQRDAALNAVRQGAGVNRLYNLVTIKSAE